MTLLLGPTSFARFRAILIRLSFNFDHTRGWGISVHIEMTLRLSRDTNYYIMLLLIFVEDTSLHVVLIHARRRHVQSRQASYHIKMLSLLSLLLLSLLPSSLSISSSPSSSFLLLLLLLLGRFSGFLIN